MMTKKDKDFNKSTTTMNMSNSVSLSNDHNQNQDNFNPELLENLALTEEQVKLLNTFRKEYQQQHDDEEVWLPLISVYPG